jgi:hypothetical protein
VKAVQTLRGLLAIACGVLAGSATAGDRTTSPDRRYAVLVEHGRMFIERLGTHKRIQVGRGLAGCCELVTVLPNEGWRAAVELHDNAFWTKPTLDWTKGRRYVLVSMGSDVYWFLAMNGQLQGDV